jgi:hypothetical protein
MALDLQTAFQGEICALLYLKCVYIPEHQVKALKEVD